MARTNRAHDWSAEEDRIVRAMKDAGRSDFEIAQELCVTSEQVRSRRRALGMARDRVEPSSYPRYDNSILVDGNAVILPDVEAPFQDSTFLNNVLDLAEAWNIQTVIAAGDLVHFDTLSAWGANWMEAPGPTVSDDAEAKILEWAKENLPKKYQDKIGPLLEAFDKPTNRTLSGELDSARSVVLRIGHGFEKCVLVLGNHEARFLRQLDAMMTPEELLRILDIRNRWIVAPYYYCRLRSGNRIFQIEHPKSHSKTTAVRLAVIHCCNILQAHSHYWDVSHDPSGSYWAITMGHIVDESRLPYASQRHGVSDRHLLGAVIVVDGYPWVLGSETPFDILMDLNPHKHREDSLQASTNCLGIESTSTGQVLGSQMQP